MISRRLESVFAARFAAALLALSVSMVSGVAPAVEPQVFLGSIGVGKGKPELESELRALMRGELASAEFSRVKTSEHYVLSATLVRLDSVQSIASTRVTCVISVAVLRDGSNLHALVNGRATAEEPSAPAARRDALRAAVHSAMARVPKALH